MDILNTSLYIYSSLRPTRHVVEVI